MVNWKVECGVRVLSASIWRRMVRRKALVNSFPKLSRAVGSRCCWIRAWNRCLSSTLRQRRRALTDRSWKFNSGESAPPTISPFGGKEGPSEDAPVDGDFDIFMYGSKAGWKIQSSSSSKNAASYDLLVPTGTGLRPRDRLRRGTTCRGERTGERERLRRVRSCKANMAVSGLAMKWLNGTHAQLI